MADLNRRNEFAWKSSTGRYFRIPYSEAMVRLRNGEEVYEKILPDRSYTRAEKAQIPWTPAVLPRAAGAGESTVSSHQPGNAVEVWAPDGEPALFGWNGHLYTVTRLIEHWKTEVQHVEHGTEDAIPDGTWTIEALSDTKAGSTVGVYELRHYPTTGRWLVAKIEEA